MTFINKERKARHSTQVSKPNREQKIKDLMGGDYTARTRKRQMLEYDDHVPTKVRAGVAI
jgi:hypothetical protein